MANEVTVPLLPCASIDEIVEFYELLGFRRSYRRTKPNPYAVVRREDWELHFFAIDGFDPSASYGSCIVQVPDVGAVHAGFASGLRARYGKVPAQGIPRMTRPPPTQERGQPVRLLGGRPGRQLDPHLPGAGRQAPGRRLGPRHGRPATERVEALAYRAELARRAGDPTRAETALAELRAIPLTDTERAQVADTLAALEDLT